MFFAFLILWIIFSGRITVEILLFGAAVSAICCVIASALFGWSFRKDLQFVCRIPDAVKLLLLLLKEIIRANLDVIRRVYSSAPPRPVFKTFEVPLKKTGSLVALADCITLTPGTVTGKTDGSCLTVHCLDEELAEGLEDSVFVRQLMTAENKNSASGNITAGRRTEQ